MNSIIYQVVALLVSAGAFLMGKYVFTNVSKTVVEKLRELSAWADKFVVWAREFMKTSTGKEKMEKVVEQLQAIAKEAGWDVTEDQLRASAQTAYENMMAGAAAAGISVVVEQTATVEEYAQMDQDAPESGKDK